MISTIQHDDLFTPGQPLPMQDQEHTHVVYVYAPSFDKKNGRGNLQICDHRGKEILNFHANNDTSGLTEQLSIAYRAVQRLAES